MAVKKVSKNLLPLLAITALFLSVSLVNYTLISDSKVKNTQSVLSESIEKEDNIETKDTKNDVAKQEEPERIEEPKKVESSSGEIEIENESETASADGKINKFKLKIKSKTVNGKTIVETASGEMEIGNKPEDAVNNLVDDNILDTPTSFEAKTSDKNKVKYEIQGIEVKKLLGLFEINLPKIVTVDADTGDVVNSSQSIWTKFLSLLSI